MCPMKVIEIDRTVFFQLVQEAVKVLRGGGVVVYPTETCYGLGVDATSQEAVDKLLQYKERPEGKAISVAVVDKKMASQYVYLNEVAKNLYQHFLPGPLTVISKSRGRVAQGLEAEDKTLGVRIPDHPLALEMIRALGKPVTATSANVSSRKTPYSINDVLQNTSLQKRQLIDLILDAGDLPRNPPSTVVDTTLNELALIREGRIRLDEVRSTCLISDSEHETRDIAAGMVSKYLDERKCLIFALQGELGTGKTQFAKGIALSLGVKENVVSPTFILVREYRVKTHPARVLYHIDTWRMKEAAELEEIGFEKMLKPGNVVVIEWLEKVRGLLEKVGRRKDVKVVWVTLESTDERTRAIRYSVSNPEVTISELPRVGLS
jgi:L-threonylcarbamoyladenylate synthase